MTRSTHPFEPEEVTWKEAASGRERKYYSLRPDGRKALLAERHQWLTVHNTLGKLWKLKPVSI